jgi:DNA-binding MarR family transcriptional regulator
MRARASRASDRGYATSRAIQALEALADGRPVSARDLAERLRINPRTARHLLQRLVYDGYVVRGPHGGDGFRAAPPLGDLGRRLATAAPQGGESQQRLQIPVGTTQPTRTASA